MSKHLKPVQRSEKNQAVQAMRNLVTILSESEDGQLVLLFIQERFGKLDKLMTDEFVAIFWPCVVKFKIDDELQKRDNFFAIDPSCALLREMLNRVFEHVIASVVAYTTNSTASVEAIARVVVESAINTMYILDEDRLSKLSRYFLHYVDNERKEIERWRKSLESLDNAQAKVHEEAINRKASGMDITAAFAEKYAKENDLPLSDRSWPNIAERFRALGMEVEYRTTYASLCSQIHNDPEDLLNYYISASFDNDYIHQYIAFNAARFSRLSLYQGVKFYLEAASRYVSCFDLDEVVPFIDSAKEDIENAALAVIANTPS